MSKVTVQALLFLAALLIMPLFSSAEEEVADVTDVERRSLKISSKLLKLGKIVRDGR